jgi:hypothetical protein
MSSLYYKHQLELCYSSWIKSLTAVDNLINQLENELPTIEDKFARKMYLDRINIFIDNYDKQIDMINLLYEYMHNYMVDRETLSYTKEKLNMARKFITSLGGDANSINWLKPTDFN